MDLPGFRGDPTLAQDFRNTAPMVNLNLVPLVREDFLLG
jgi:hypothetical protein